MLRLVDPGGVEVARREYLVFIYPFQRNGNSGTLNTGLRHHTRPRDTQSGRRTARLEQHQCKAIVDEMGYMQSSAPLQSREGAAHSPPCASRLGILKKSE